MESYQNKETGDLLTGLPKEMYAESGFDAMADLDGQVYLDLMTATRVAGARSAPGFAKELKCVHRVYGTLYTTPFDSASGTHYKGHYYDRDPKRPVRKFIIHQVANGAVNITDATLNAVAIKRIGSWHFTVMTDGEIIQWLPLYVAGWTTGKYEADIDAVTVEVENCGGAPDWRISDAAQRSLVELMAEVAEYFPGIELYYFDGTKAGSNVHRHEWYCNTNCPGPFIKSITMDLISKANDLIAAAEVPDGFTGIRKVGGSYYLYIGGRRMTEQKEYHDETADVWYHVGADGCAAVSKDVRIPYTFQGEEPEHEKWCRYDSEGHMVKGWDVDGNGQVYYFDLVSGSMAKGKLRGTLQVDGADLQVVLDFDEKTGKLLTVNAEV